MLALAAPDARYHASYLATLAELEAEGNGHFFTLVLPPEPGFAGASYDATSLADPQTFAEFCAYTSALAAPETPRPAVHVTSSHFWMVDDDEVVGRISLRHALTPWLLEAGGHIGYAVRPTARRRGHATVSLGLVLPVAAGRGIDPALVTCDEDNVASRRVIESNGGVLEDHRNGKLRFWVPTG